MQTSMSELVLEDVVFPFGEGSPRLVLHAVLPHELVRLDLLVERMCLDLVHRRDDLVVTDEVQQAIGRARVAARALRAAT
jgi:hypothetical protein